MTVQGWLFELFEDHDPRMNAAKEGFILEAFQGRCSDSVHIEQLFRVTYL